MSGSTTSSGCAVKWDAPSPARRSSSNRRTRSRSAPAATVDLGGLPRDRLQALLDQLAEQAAERLDGDVEHRLDWPGDRRRRMVLGRIRSRVQGGCLRRCALRVRLPPLLHGLLHHLLLLGPCSGPPPPRSEPNDGPGTRRTLAYRTLAIRSPRRSRPSVMPSGSNAGGGTMKRETPRSRRRRTPSTSGAARPEVTSIFAGSRPTLAHSPRMIPSSRVSLSSSVTPGKKPSP